MESKKMFYTMGEVAEMFDVSSSLIRYWEKQFSVIKPVRNKKGNRLFTPKDIESFKQIYHLVKERGMTLEGAKKSLRGGNLSVSREVELMDRLLGMRSLLLEVREVLKEQGEELEPEAVAAPVEVKETTEIVDVEPASEVTAEPSDGNATERSQSEVSKEKELFAFYEQNLF